MSGTAPAVAGLPDAPAVLVVFWASWCAPCRKELPDLAKLAAAPPGGLEILGLSQDDTAEEARDFLESIGAGAVESRMDPGGAISTEFGVRALPGAVLVVDGQLRARFDGPQRWDGRPMRTLLAKLSAAP